MKNFKFGFAWSSVHLVEPIRHNTIVVFDLIQRLQGIVKIFKHLVRKHLRERKYNVLDVFFFFLHVKHNEKGA